MDPSKPGMRRVTVHQNRPNPLFEQWLEEWCNEAAEKQSNMQHCFRKALRSLQKYPLRLKSGRDCIVLECFGDKLCKLLDRRLAEYRKTHPEGDDNPQENMLPHFTVPEQTKAKRTPKEKRGKNLTQNGDAMESTEEPPKKVARQSNGKNYVPGVRSGNWAVLLTLLSEEEKPNFKGFMLKAELQKAAQPLSDTSFMRSKDPSSHYTAWSSVSLLVKKELVRRFSNPAKYCLTDEGRDLAKRLREKKGNDDDGGDIYRPIRQTQDNISPEPESQFVQTFPKVKSTSAFDTRKTKVHDWEVGSSEQPLSLSPEVTVTAGVRKAPSKQNYQIEGSSGDINCQSQSPVVLESGSFNVLLLVDTCETGGATKKRHNETVSVLTQMNVPFEVRKLEVGDFLWIARSKSSPHDELILPYIVERKRMDDLGGSIKDDRFKEQKFRLKQSGIQNLIYLIESHGSDQHVGLPLTTLQQAAVNTQIVEGFIVKHTIDHRHSMAYLASLTHILERSFLKKTLLGCLRKDLADYTMSDDFVTLINYKEFKQHSKKTKNFSVKEMFIRQLVQLKGLSVGKALAITDKYPTPQSLIQAYRCGGDENLLSDILCKETSRCVGPATSKAVHIMYSSRKLH